ncbi:MAG: CaiB/BaiF CoA-transferase family protein [Chloroflexota bacterium]|jgi:alpha-methylacyl-CoA racemase
MPGPLTSLKILDFTTLLPGPFATMMLADMGADVVRVESPHRPDLVRQLPPFDEHISAWHAVLNRNKRSIDLDLKHPQAADVVRRLVKQGGYDIVIEQFRPGVMDRLGIGYEALRSATPALIYCALTGYGQNGPYRDRAGHDINYLALSGILSYSGRRDSGPPPLGVQVADIGGGSFGALVGLLAAVIHRHQTGEGQVVDISMFDLMVAWQSHLISHALVAGEAPAAEAMVLNGGRVYDLYQTADGRWLSVGSLEPKFWEGFCAAIERADLVDSGLSFDPQILKWVKVEVAKMISARSLDEWVAIFSTLDVCVEPLLSIPEMLEHPQTLARELIVEVPKPDGSTQKQIGTPIRFSAGQTEYRHVGRDLGANTSEVLKEAGFTKKNIESLKANRVFG